MNISSEDWKKYIKKMSGLCDTASSLIAEYITKNGLDDEKLLDYALAVATKYGEGSAALASSMYEAIAEEQGQIVPTPETAETPDMHEIARTINGTQKFSQNAKVIGDAVGRLVKRTGADTMLINAKRDGAEFAWIPSGDTCAFCIMLASRGWQHISKNALKNGHAEHIHAHCDCNYAVRFDGKMKVEGYDPKAYRQQYESAEGNTPEEKIRYMRREAYAEASLRSKDNGEYGVNWREVKSKEYTKSFAVLSNNEKANELAAKRARNALRHRSGKNTEEIYAISLTTGKDVAKITDQNHEFGIERTEKFTEDVRRAKERGEKVLFIHNHPRGYPPSVVDINELLLDPEFIGITIGHDGSIYLYGAPNKKIEESDEKVANRKLKWYSNDEKANQERVIEELQKQFDFLYERIR